MCYDTHGANVSHLIRLITQTNLSTQTHTHTYAQAELVVQRKQDIYFMFLKKYEF